jgi:uncharacterized SAM-binding protein YcdF (DUF218 family)
VVATDLIEINRFNDDHGQIVEVAKSPAEFAAAIERTLRSPLSDAAVARRVAVAQSNSWQSRIAKMLALIEQAASVRQGREGRWEARLKRAYRAARRRSVAIVAGLVIAYILVFQTTLVWWAAEPLKINETPGPADAIVVFAGGAGESGEAGGGYQERVKQAVDLYNEGFAARMIFSTGYVFAFKEGEVMRSLALTEGIPDEAIILETQARNTFENVARSRDILIQNGWRRVLLVSSPYHMRRAMLTWRKVAPEMEVVAAPVPFSQFYLHERGPSLVQMRGLLQEYAAIVWYWWRGWI